MDFIDQVLALSSKIQKQKDVIQTEEATKSAFVLPFINLLGYDIFDPHEIVPEFTADLGLKKGEKVDYAIMKDNSPIMIIECKQANANLDMVHASQLFRYFHVTPVKIGILTNGIIYRFYTDLEEINKMDPKPFMEFNFLDIQDPLVHELKRLTKATFNLTDIITVAADLKYTKEIKRILGEQFVSPVEDFVRFFARQLYSGKVTQSILDQFTEISKRALTQFINERINERLKSAMSTLEVIPASVSPVANQTDIGTSEDGEQEQDQIMTTVEELEGYYIVKAILREHIDPARLVYRDNVSYFGILLDDNNRRPICRLHLNRSKKYLGLFDENKNEERVQISSMNDLFQYSDRLKATLFGYEKKKHSDTSVPPLS